MLHDPPPAPVGLSPPPPPSLCPPPAPAWTIRVYRVRSERCQQRIVDAFARIGRDEVTVSPAQSGPEWFVIVEYVTTPAEAHVSRVVLTIDPGAVRTYECEAPVERRGQRSWTGFAVPLDDVEDAELLQRARDGERTAFDVLCSRHSYAARRLARKLGAGREGPRMVADAFARALVTAGSDREFLREVFGLLRADARRSAAG
jgi:hypothetical protein